MNAASLDEDNLIEYVQSMKIDSPVPEEQAAPDAILCESAIADIQLYLRKYSTTSSVFAEQSITNPDYQRTLYCISCILQAELFDDLKSSHAGAQQHPELLIYTTLPPHLGGPVEKVAVEILDRECQDDPELRFEIEAGTVPTVDTILRFISWLHQSAKYSAQCNIVAFIYVKRMMDAKAVLTMQNWRGLWLGAVMLAQKVFDDASLRTSSFASILPGVTKPQLKALELKIFTMLNYCTGVKPSVYARFYFELREIFKSITGEFTDASLLSARAPRRRPLTIKSGKVLRQCVDDPSLSLAGSARSSKSSSPRPNKNTANANPTSSSTLPAAASPSALQQQQHRAQHQHQLQQSLALSGGTSSSNQDAVRLPQLSRVGSPTSASASVVATTAVFAAAGSMPSSRSLDDGAGSLHPQPQQQHDLGQLQLPASSATTPGQRRRQGAGRGGRGGQPAARTLEDFDFINPSIFVLS